MRDFKAFEDYENGRYKLRMENIYNKALKQCYLRGSDIKLIQETMIMLFEKDVTYEMTQIMDRAEQYGNDCISTDDGWDIYKKSEKDYKEELAKKEIQDQILQTEMELDEKIQRHEKFMSEQVKTKNDLDEVKKRLKQLKLKNKKITLEGKDTEEVKEIVNV